MPRPLNKTTMPLKQLELPPAIARNFVRDMRAFFAEKDTIKADGIAAGTTAYAPRALSRQAADQRRQGDVSCDEG